MKKLIPLILLFFLFSCNNSSGKVYICTGIYAKAYHKKLNCEGLGNCKGEIKTVTLEEAKNMRRTPCGYCY